MELFPKMISSVFGIGYFGKGGGTIAAAICCLAWYALGIESFLWTGAVTLLIIFIGVWSASEVEPYWGVDSGRVVIDEIAGMCISLLFLPITVGTVALGLLFFRFFDIVKPFYIKRMERFPKGWGVMADDVLAGIYANILLQVMVKFSIL